MTLTTFFSGGQLDRATELRSDPALLLSVLENPDSRFVVVWQSRCLIKDDALLLLKRDELGNGWKSAESIYLGRLGHQHIFATELPDSLLPDGPAANDFENFRVLMGTFPPADAALFAYAKGMVEWQKRHRYCGLCGAANQSAQGGFVMQCSAADCDGRSFPRLDPAIIVLTLHEDKCLLGRQVSWPAGRFSTIAGFVEPGESLEDAVVREVCEETNVQVATTRYLGSQPWPFPNAIMLGFHADAGSTNIVLNDGELAEAGWFSREDLAAGTVALPPPQSIAFRLIEHWFDQWDGQPLSSFNLSTDFRR